LKFAGRERARRGLRLAGIPRMKLKLEVDGSDFLGCPEVSPGFWPVACGPAVVASDLTTFAWRLGASACRLVLSACMSDDSR
jgi:hypothetical protein